MFNNFSTKDINCEIKTVAEMKQENELLSDIKSLNIDKINKLSSESFDNIYGRNSSKWKVVIFYSVTDY
jgi:hypothetical protein